MKAKDSVKNYDSKIREYVNYSYRQSKNACKNYGARPSGGEKESELRNHLVSELETCADSVVTEEFKFAKTTSFSESIFSFIFFVIASVLTVLDCFGLFGESSLPSIIAAVSVLIGAAIILFPSLENMFSSLFAKKLSSSNIYAVRNADNEAKKRLVLVAHSDSLPKRKFRTEPFTVITTIGFFLTLAVLFVNSHNNWFSTVPALKYSTFALIAFIPFALIPAFADSGEFSEGASDNLSGSFASIAVLKYLKDNSIEIRNTEISVLITSAHFYGCEGAKAFYKKHSSQFTDIPTVFIGLDSIAGKDTALGTVKSDNKSGSAASELISSGASDAGIELNSSSLQGKYTADSLTFGSSSSCTLTSLDSDFAKSPDGYEDMKVKTIENALKTVVSALFIYDEE